MKFHEPHINLEAFNGFVIFTENEPEPRPGRTDHCISYGISTVSGGECSVGLAKNMGFIKTAGNYGNH